EAGAVEMQARRRRVLGWRVPTTAAPSTAPSTAAWGLRLRARGEDVAGQAVHGPVQPSGVHVPAAVLAERGERVDGQAGRLVVRRGGRRERDRVEVAAAEVTVHVAAGER